MRRILAAVCFAWVVGPARAESGDDAPKGWVEGVKDFREAAECLRCGEPSRDRFRAAAEAFEQIVLTDSDYSDSNSPATYLNAGNARYLAGDLPEAIAAYHAGLRRVPFDSRLREQLFLARRDVEFGNGAASLEHPPEWPWRLFDPWLVPAAQMVLIAGSFFLSVGVRSRRRILIGFGGVAALLFIAFVAAAVVRERFHVDLIERPVVVVRVDAPLRLGNAQSYESELVLPRGYEVRRLGERGGWLHVACPGGPVGWIPRVSGIEP